MRLKHLRELLNISEEYMADRLKISVDQYRALEASQADQRINPFEDDRDPEPSKEPDMFNTEPVLRRLLSTSNHAVQIQIEENQKLRQENTKLKRSIVLSKISTLWSQAGCSLEKIKLNEIDYMILKLSGVTRMEAEKIASEIQEKFKEEEE